MSWRETLGLPPSTATPYTHNTQNPQKPAASAISADSADSASRDSDQESSKLLEVLADACRGLAIKPIEVKEALSPDDIDDWREGAISTITLVVFARSLMQRREMDQGKPPNHYTAQATCKYCGPIWLWYSGVVVSCPWCWNRAADKPIPRPCTIHCGDCIHFERIDHPHLGHCAKGQPEAIAGLWNTDRRYCERFLPGPRQTNNDPARPETKGKFPK